MRRLLAVAAVLLGLTAPTPAAAQEQPSQVVVVGVAGLRWDDVGASTPTLARLAGTAAVGALSVKALPDVSCPADGWWTLVAGARAEAFGGGCEDPPGERAAELERNAASRDGARVDALVTALDDVVDARGTAAEAAAGLPSTRPARLQLVDGGVVRAGPTRPADLRAADAAVALAEGGLAPGSSLLVVGLSGSPGDESAHLHVALATGPSFPRGALSSPSTRRAPYVQLVDVAPTVLDLLDEQVPEVMDGQPWRVSGPAPSVAELVDLDRRAVASREVTVPFFVVLVGALLVLLPVLRRRPGALRLVALAGTAAPGATYLAGLVPWWRAGEPLVVLVALVVALSAAAALAASRRRHAVGLVTGATAAVLVVDLLTGAHLQMDAVAGYSPLVAGRFAGLGNVAFGVYAACALLATASLASGRERAGLLVGLAGLVAVAVDGAPPWGSDVGGVLALVPAYALLALLLTGRRASLPRLLAALAAAAAVVTAFALADLARAPEDRTHLGRFAEDVADGTAGDVLARKAEAVLDLLLRSPVTAALPVVVAVAVALVLRPPPRLRRALDEVPGLRPGLAAVGLASAVGFAVNDSGAAVPATALLVTVPAVVAVVEARRDDPPGPAGGET